MKNTLEIPRRLSLVAQTCAALRKGIEKKVWAKCLPGERSLSDLLLVSRPTVRAALRMLAKDGLLQIHRGRLTKLCLGKTVQRRARIPKQIIGIVMQDSPSHMTFAVNQSLSDMRTHLMAGGFMTEIVTCTANGTMAQQRKLDAFLRHNRVYCCILLSVSKEIQQWFFDRSLPALVMGSCHPNIRLPSLDTDNYAVGRHAAGVFLRNGHRKVAVIVPDSSVAGDLAGEKGFTDAIKCSGFTDAEVWVVRHKGTAASIASKLNSLWNSEHPPTALFVAKAPHVFIVLIYLLKHGLKVPDNVSFIARDQDYMFEMMDPAFAHYTAGDAYARRLPRLIRQMIDRGDLPSEPNLIFPKYFPGATVKRLS